MFCRTKDQNADAMRMTNETYGTQQYWSAGAKHMYDHLPSSGGPRHDENARAATVDTEPASPASARYTQLYREAHRFSAQKMRRARPPTISAR